MGFHECTVVNRRLGSSELACVAFISVFKDVLFFVMSPIMELLGGVQIITVVRFVGDVD